jgi:hypothetical protein
MKLRTGILAATLGAATVLAVGAYAVAQQMPAMGHGMMGQGMRHGAMMNHEGGHMPGAMAHEHSMAQDHAMGSDYPMGMGHGMRNMMRGVDTTATEEQELFDMFASHTEIRRVVTNLPNGIHTLTESDNPELAASIVSHVAGMINRIEDARDPKVMIQSPTLEVLFRNHALIETTLEPTANGIIVIQTSNDPETVAALQKHAAEVSDLAERGMASVHDAMMSNAAAPLHN